MALRERDAGSIRPPDASRSPVLLTVVGIGVAIVGGIAMYWLLSPPRRPDHPDRPDDADQDGQDERGGRDDRAPVAASSGSGGGDGRPP
jgi:hypothetical protein